MRAAVGSRVYIALVTIESLVAIVAALAAVVSAAFAGVQARAAAHSRDEVRSTMALLERQTIATETQAQVAVRAATRPPWSDVRAVRGDVRGIQNTSGESITVLAVEVMPEGAESLVDIEDDLPAMYEAGEELLFAALTRLTFRPRTMTLVWRFGNSAVHRTRVPL